MLGDIVIPTIKIAAAPMLPVFIPAVLPFIVAVRSQEVVRLQEVVLLPEAELPGARMSPTAVADAVGNK
jgi:hypothetical protein